MGGGHAKVHAVVHRNGETTVRKRYSRPADADREEIGSLVAHAVGMSVPASVRTDEHTVHQTLVPGQTATQHRDSAIKSLFGTPGWAAHQQKMTELKTGDDAKRIALTDWLLNNQDRSDDNWMIHGNRLHAIDHGASNPQDSGGRPQNESRATFWPLLHLGDGPNLDPQPNDYSSADLGVVRSRLETLRPEFQRMGKGRWYNQMMKRLATIEQHASGTHRLIHDKSITASVDPMRSLDRIDTTIPVTIDSLFGVHAT